MIQFSRNQTTWAGCDRSEIPSRVRPYVRPEQFVGRLLIELPGYSLDWTLPQDMRDPRRFRALDLSGVEYAHAAPKELLRQVALIVPTYHGSRQ